MSFKKINELECKKKIRTYSKRLLTALSVALGIGYLATLALHISGFSLHFAIAGIILSVLSLILNTWSFNHYFENKKLNIKLKRKEENPKKLTKIHIDIASSIFFLIGGIESVSPFIETYVASYISTFTIEAYLAPYVPTFLFALGYTMMAISFIKSILLDSEKEDRSVSLNSKTEEIQVANKTLTHEVN
ncbi:hypothetical protein [Wolbachia endosymbiont of Chironomus riparius]|uniref:hypothetical protein n=1 Tax=Wolbachia endosymbiont of Chironomus riparius TaxID=2883238 RepID=UPI0020A0C0E0|nr:hypothetical protein [Wolbachia endosymbiont of Chironomus riparius]